MPKACENCPNWFTAILKKYFNVRPFLNEAFVEQLINLAIEYCVPILNVSKYVQNWLIGTINAHEICHRIIDPGLLKWFSFKEI